MVNVNKKMLFYISVATTFIVMFTLNTLTPYITDDYTYATSNNLYDVFNNEYMQYMTWGGRSIAHINVRIFLMMPKIVFNIVNSFMYVLLTVLAYFFAKLKVKEDFSVVTYIFVSACLWLYLPSFGQTVLWLTGSCNYLWGTVFVLLFLCPYRLYFSGKTVFKGKWMPLIIMFFIGVVAGWCNENTSGGCILLLLLLSGYGIYSKMKIKNWMVSGFFGVVIGFLFMVLAPGNALRSRVILKDKSRFAVMSSNISNCAYFIENSLMILIILLCLFLVMKMVINKDIKQTVVPIIFTFVSFATMYVMAFSPANPARSWFGGVVFLIIAVAISFCDIIQFKDNFSKIVAFTTVVALSIYTATSLSASFIDIAYTKKLSDIRDSYIISQRDSGNLDVEVSSPLQHKYTKHNPMRDQDEIIKDKNYWGNKVYAERFGLNSIVAKQ